MTFDRYKSAFEKKANKIGYSQDNLIACLEYARKLFESNVPVIYNTSHLSALVGYNKDYLKRAVSYTNSFYRTFDIRKKNGKKREISEPLPSMKDIQLWILQNILYKIPVSKYAKAYVPKLGMKAHLNLHKKQATVLSMDIENFFPSIKLEQVEEVFRSLGYSKLISNLLAKLCCKERSLPQGAPTSPYLSNIILKEFDEDLFKYCSGNDIRYSRYADDLTFSGNSFDEKPLQEFVQLELKKLGFRVNKDKTKSMSPHERQIVTGVVVNKFPQVPFEKRNTIRQEMHYIMKFGLTSHMEFKKITQTNYLDHLLGKINFILSVHPKDSEFIKYKEFLIGLKFS